MLDLAILLEVWRLFTFVVNDVYDFWRLANFVVGLLCIVWSVGGYLRQHKTWNAKSFNLWYSRLMWALVECIISIEGLYHAREWTWSLPFITIAGLSSFVALYKRGSWGYQPQV